jgi:hypothetical protein
VSRPASPSSSGSRPPFDGHGARRRCSSPARAVLMGDDRHRRLHEPSHSLHAPRRLLCRAWAPSTPTPARRLRSRGAASLIWVTARRWILPSRRQIHPTGLPDTTMSRLFVVDVATSGLRLRGASSSSCCYFVIPVYRSCFIFLFVFELGNS